MIIIEMENYSSRHHIQSFWHFFLLLLKKKAETNGPNHQMDVSIYFVQEKKRYPFIFAFPHMKYYIEPFSNFD